MNNMEERAKNAQDIFTNSNQEKPQDLASTDYQLLEHVELSLDPSAVYIQSIAVDPILSRIYVSDVYTGLVYMFEKLEYVGPWPPKYRFDVPRSIMTLPDKRIGKAIIQANRK